MSSTTHASGAPPSGAVGKASLQEYVVDGGPQSGAMTSQPVGGTSQQYPVNPPPSSVEEPQVVTSGSLVGVAPREHVSPDCPCGHATLPSLQHDPSSGLADPTQVSVLLSHWRPSSQYVLHPLSSHLPP